MTQDIEIDQQGQEPSEEDTEVFTSQTSQEEEEADGHEEVKVAQDHELKVLPENEEEDKEEILITDATKMPSTAKTKTRNNKQRDVQKRGKGKALPNQITKILNRQTGEIDKMALQLSSVAKQLKLMKNQSDLVKQLGSQLRQIQKQMSQIQKGIRTNKQVNTNKKKRNGRS